MWLLLCPPKGCKVFVYDQVSILQLDAVAPNCLRAAVEDGSHEEWWQQAQLPLLFLCGVVL